MMPQHGGKYGDHEFVKVASKVIKGVERAPYTKFETILVNYDKMKDIKEKRNLTKTEQRIYDQADKLIKKEFDAMFKKADTMLDQLDQKTPDQKEEVEGRISLARLIRLNPATKSVLILMLRLLQLKILKKFLNLLPLLLLVTLLLLLILLLLLLPILKRELLQ